MGFIGSLVGGIMGSNAADDAAGVESQAAKKAQDLSKSNQDATNQFQQDVWSGTKAAEQPYQDLGATSANSLNNLLKTGFKAPTLEEAQKNPGYQFALNTGTDALEKGASARGNLLSGSEGTALQSFGQQLGETNYQDVYNNALQSYMANYNTLQGGTNTGLSSTGQLGQFGQDAANTTANVNLKSSEDQMQQINNAAAARASGYLGSANAWSTAAGGMASGLAEGLGNMDFSGGSNPLEMAGQFFGV